MLYYERCEKARMRIPLKVPKENRRIYPVSEELKAYGRKKPNGGKKHERYFNEAVIGSRCSFWTSDKKMES